MGLNRDSYYSDAIANLYRAAYFLTRGSVALSLDFLRRAKARINTNLNPKIIEFLNQPEKYLKDSKSKNYWAEKILDEYLRLKRTKF